MAILTGRLEALALQIEPGETMADIGTDHGFLPITLFTQGICPKVILSDVSEKALARARRHGENVLGLSEENYRTGDGLAPLNPGEVDVVVLAGMGGILMSTIMAADLAKANTISKFIFQPRNHPEVLRRWLIEHRFSIVRESLVRERRNICEIIVAAPNNPQESLMNGIGDIWPQDDIRWKIPPWFAALKDPLAKEFLHRKLERERRIVREIKKKQSPDIEHQKELEKRIDYIQTLYEKRE